MFVTAEFLNQTLSKKIFAEVKEPYDGANIRHCAIFGTVAQGPMLTLWYRWLDKNYIGIKPITIIKKLSLDQFLFTPVLYVTFYISMSAMERREHIFEELVTKFPKTFLVSCIFWMPVQTGNFIFVPPMYRVIYMGCAAFFWVTILCYIKSQNMKQ